MKLFFKYCILGCLVAICSACNDKIAIDGEDADMGPSLYITFTVKMNEGGLPTRSATDDPDDDGYVTSEDGKEIGKERENNISDIILIFADEDERYIQSGSAPVSRITTNKYALNFHAADLENYNKDGNLKVYLFCNPDTKLKEAVAGCNQGSSITSLLNKTYSIANGESENSRAWEDNHFFMSNAVPHSAYYPGSTSGFGKNNPWDLGTIRVERSVARFDYKAKNSNNIYRIYDKTDGSEDYNRNPNVSVKLTDIALVNMSKSFYYWKRVSNAADGYSNPVISGTETFSNYVVDTDALQKSEYGTNGWDNKKDYYFYNIESSDDRKFTSLSDISGNEEDEDESWNDDQTHNGYHIWRYASENTVPKMDKKYNAILTGIVFKAMIVADNGSRLESLMKNKKTIYEFDNVMYGDWDDVKNAAQKGDNPKLEEAYDAVCNGESYRDAGFKSFMPNDDGNYYSRYYYCNKHNDNGKEDDTAPMKYGVVRNNVYKLQVDALYGFGEPEEPGPEPENPPVDPEDPPVDPEDPPVDPEDPPVDPPTDPEDIENVQLKLTVKVLPWVEREFTINFGKNGTN